MFDPMKTALDGMTAMMRFWTDMAARSLNATMASSADSTPGDAAREIRSAMFKAWADAWDNLARSPEFLEMMRQSLSAGAQFRKQMFEGFAPWQQMFAAPSRPNFEQWAGASQQWQENVLAAMENMASQVRQFARRLDALERGLDEEQARRKKRRREKPARAGKHDR